MTKLSKSRFSVGRGLLFLVICSLIISTSHSYALEEPPESSRSITVYSLSTSEEDSSSLYTEENIPRYPFSIDVDSNHNIYAGTGLGGFGYPILVGINSDTEIDYSGVDLNNYVYKYRPNGELDTSFANNGILTANCSDDRDLNDLKGYYDAFVPTTVKVDNQNNIYVESALIVGTSTVGSLLQIKSVCLQKFDSNGNFISKPYEVIYPEDSELFPVGEISIMWAFWFGIRNIPIGTIDNQGNLYYLNNFSLATTTTEVIKFDSVASSTVLQFNYDPDDDGSYYAMGLFVDKHNNIYVLDSNGSDNSRLFQFDPQGNLIKEFPVPYSNALSDINIDKDGNVYELFYLGVDGGVYGGGAAPEIFKYSPAGELLSNWTMYDYYAYMNDETYDRSTPVMNEAFSLVSDSDNIYVGGMYQQVNDLDGDDVTFGGAIQLYSYPHQDEEEPTNNQTTTTYSPSPAMLACDPTLYTPQGYLTPKPGGLPACVGGSQINTGPATITFSDGTTYTINNNNTTIYNTNNTNTPTTNDTTNNNTYSFTRDLELGMSGGDVQSLQIYLNTHGYTVATSGAGSTGNETDYFGTLTQKSLSKFQKDNNIYPTAGYFGPMTRAFIVSH